MPGHESPHNEAYWANRDYLGLGPGAFSTIDRQRWHNVADTKRYLRDTLDGKSVRTGRENLSEEHYRMERLALGLRTSRGVAIPEIEPIDLRLVEELIQSKQLEKRQNRLILTVEGRVLADEIAARLLQ